MERAFLTRRASGKVMSSVPGPIQLEKFPRVHLLEEEVGKKEAQEAERSHNLDGDALDVLSHGRGQLAGGLLARLCCLGRSLAQAAVIPERQDLRLGRFQLRLELLVGQLHRLGGLSSHGSRRFRQGLLALWAVVPRIGIVGRRGRAGGIRLGRGVVCARDVGGGLLL